MEDHMASIYSPPSPTARLGGWTATTVVTMVTVFVVIL